ncbi:hypothetical protein AG0111_0g1985 [Alternaria gaisen]|uniref:Uncharacterized protein n=1 Tax=Alternaria gaisen TaxID=167740 RepID=A0ACB6G059_9PLEO|nr:hypothetical protein AG0111_0g1985 [Alternaria gaisen]
MEPRNDGDTAPPDAKLGPVPKNSHVDTADELDSMSREVADSLQHTRALFLQDLITILVVYTASLFIGHHFLVSLFFMLLLGLAAEMRLRNMRQNFEKAINTIRLGYDATIENGNATMKVCFEGNEAIKDLAQSSLDTVYDSQKALYKSSEAFAQLKVIRERNILMLRKQENEMRLGCFQVYLSIYEGLIDVIEQIVKKVKTTAQPKVKGTKRNSKSRNEGFQDNLTHPLEGVAAELKQRQCTTKNQIAVAEKIKAILELDGLLPDEIDRLVKEADGDLQHSQDASLPQRPADSHAPNTGVSPSPLNMYMDGKLERHYEDLDKLFQGLHDRPIVEEEDS